jgi:hypothetical protein
MSSAFSRSTCEPLSATKALLLQLGEVVVLADPNEGV